MAVTFGYENLIPYMYFDGASVYYPPDTTGIVTGTESWVTPTQRGLTLGCWAKFSDSTAGGLIALYDTTGDKRSYFLWKNTDNTIKLTISSDGTYTNIDSAISSGSVTVDNWHFIAGRWNTTKISVFIDQNATYATATQSSIYGGQHRLAFGGYSNGLSYLLTGYMAYPFICAASLSDEQIKNIYNKTRTLFGV